MIKWTNKERNSSDNGYLYEGDVDGVKVGKLVYDNSRRTEYYFRGVDYENEEELFKAAKKADPRSSWINRERTQMTSKQLEEKINDAVKQLKADNVKKAAKKAWDDYFDEVKSEISKKESMDWEDIDEDQRERLVDRFTDMYPMENYLYVMFNDEGDLDGWTIDHNQYFQGHSGPTSAISIHSGGVDYDDIRRELGNDLFEAIETDD